MSEHINKDELNKLFGLFHLDIRSSQRELEIAYDVLTANKNVPQEYMKAYRNTFEYLMLNHFKDEGLKLNVKKEDYYTEDEHCKEILKNLSDPIKEGLKEVKKEANLSEKALALLAVQKVNLPMFFKSITQNCCNFFGIQLWTKKRMNKILSECMANPLVYCNMSFSFTCAYYTDRNEVYSFIKNMAKYYSSDKTLCKEFKYNKTPKGVTGWVIIESDLSYHLAETLQNKAEVLDCGVSITSST